MISSVRTPAPILAALLLACDNATGPIAPSTDRFASIVAGGGLTCAVGLDAHAYCWGENGVGQVGSRSSGRCLDSGLNPVACAMNPQRVPIEGTVARVTTGSGHACALMADGSAYCWGGNWAGQVGAGAPEPRPPQRVSVVPLVELRVGPEHSCGLAQDGVIWCWGVNDYGQLGRGTNDMDAHSQPSPLETDLRFASIGRGFSQTTCAMTAGGEPYCWGPNDGGAAPGQGVLGDTARHECLASPFFRFGTECNMTPMRAMPGLVFSDMSVGLIHACGRSGGEWICWGNAVNGQLGIGTPQDCLVTRGGSVWHIACNRDRVPVIGGSAFARVDAGGTWTCGLDAAGQGWCWGFNSWGGLGTGIREHWVEEPAAIVGDLVLTSITVGSAHACGLEAGGYAYCWGYARTGAIGDGTFSDSPALEPRRVVARN